MSKKIFQGLMLLTVFSWYENALADRDDWCLDGYHACAEYCKKLQKQHADEMVCVNACYKGEVACKTSTASAKPAKK